MARVVSEHGRLDVVWANAGIASLGPIALTSPAAWTRTVEVNLLGAYYTVRAALPAVIAERGYVAVSASLASFGQVPHMSAYCATKAGIEAMCNSLRTEVAQYGVDVATIHPSWTDTDMVRESDASTEAFRILRATLRPPLRRTYPVERVARDIVAGFAGRRRRICTPRFVYAMHALRPLLTTWLIERDLRAVAPEMQRTFEQELATRGAEGASVSERIAAQLGRSSS